MRMPSVFYGSGRQSLRGRLDRMSLNIALPLMLVIVLIASLSIWYACRYRTVLGNITESSAFNQNFRTDIDLKMSYFVVDHQSSEGLPMEEVRRAGEIAKSLSGTTVDRDSLRAIRSVYNLCHNLEQQIRQLADTPSYSERQERLENNIYFLTALIEKYMYRYLFCESVYLEAMQRRMINGMIALMLMIPALAQVMLAVLLRKCGQLNRKITDPVDKLCQRLTDIGRGELTVCEPVEANVAEVQLLSDGIERMVGQLRSLMAENTAKEKQRRRTELALLQAQINPHFLYNTLDTIIWLIESGDVRQAVEMINSLSNFFRFSLSRGKSIITLAEEKRHIESYLEIQAVRYRDLMEYEIDIPEELAGYTLPKLTLQPLVENALYHGIKMKRRTGHILVRGWAEGERILLEVSDDGAGIGEERLRALRETLTDSRRGSESFGLRAVHQRITLLFGAEYGLTLQSTLERGTRVTVTIPKVESPAEPPPAAPP